ncbi:hypothetical protein M407DRAFT_146121 [Tulasnella calospora MUT 4182]|uniref:Uncharacterized protein n=1 Tax=Tulasnella calospora MUT 4182 TaxID=1051891 RepID=A0A0C3QSB9_9AGAM|nr:hypothetical protein M407DRAFT_146121 [Tulasnella calospora MUT 4182]
MFPTVRVSLWRFQTIQICPMEQRSGNWTAYTIPNPSNPSDRVIGATPIARHARGWSEGDSSYHS